MVRSEPCETGTAESLYCGMLGHLTRPLTSPRGSASPLAAWSGAFGRMFGMTPKCQIECRRLQHAATTLFAAPDSDLSALAGDLRHTDHPLLSR